MTDEHLDPATAKFQAAWRAARFDEMTRLLETELKANEPATPFHAIVGRSFLGQLNEAVDWLTGAYDSASRQFDVTVMDVEMCHFVINTDAWLLWAFAFDIPEEEAFEDLGCYSYETEEPFHLTGMEDIQAAMTESSEYMFDRPDNQRQAFSDCCILVTAHMMELMATAYQTAREAGHPIGRVPFFAGVHDDPHIYDAERGTIETCRVSGELSYRLGEEEQDWEE